MADSITKLRATKQNVLISGGSGLVGMKLSKLLADKGHHVAHLSRNPTKGVYPSFYWDVKKMEIDEQAVKEADVIIHLAGASVAGKRWSQEWKKEIYDSRIDSTQLLYESVKKYNPQLTKFISASAIGFYGWDTGDQVVTELQEKGEGFLADVVEDWEKEVKKFKDLGIKTSLLRIGIVLSTEGGALVEMKRPIDWGLGAPLGSGKQLMSWIHIDDLCQQFIHLMESQAEGIYNGVAPQPVTNKQFTKQLAKALSKPCFLPNVPPFMLSLIVGEMAVILLGGNRVSSKKIEDTGFNFRFPSLDSALKDLLG